MHVTVTRYYDVDSKLHTRLKNQVEEKRRQKLMELQYMYASIEDRYIPPSMRIKHNNSLVGDDALCKGDITMKRIDIFLNRLYRSPQQKEFHNSFLATCVRLIFGDDYEQHKHRITMQYKFKSRRQQLIVCAPRRLGKTFAVSYFCICMALHLPGIEISIFSPGKRQSVALMGHIVDFLQKLGEDERIVKRNEEKLFLRTDEGAVSKINAFPSAVETLKGVGGSILVLEEMAQIDENVLYEVIMPIHQLDDTCIIGISTITTEFNFMTQFLKLKDSHGANVFAIQHITLACEECRRNGVPHKCTHNDHLLPSWSSTRKRKTIMYMTKGKEELMAREIGGIASQLHKKAFPDKYLNIINKLPPCRITNNMYCTTIFHAVDPNGGGSKSDYAIISFVIYSDVFVVVGMESFPSKSSLENDRILIRHLLKLRQDEKFKMTQSVFIIESNLGFESERIAITLSQSYDNYVIMNEKNDNTHVGFRTTNSVKQIAVETLRERILSEELRFADEETMVCLSREYNETMEMFITQLANFAEVIKENLISKPKKFYSGKDAGKDDMVMALLIGIHWVAFWFNSPKYAEYR